MRVAIDAHAIGTRAGGNESYVRALLAALRDHADGVQPIALQSPESIADGDVITDVETVPIPFANSPLRAIWSMGAAAKKAGADLLHGQYFVPRACPVPTVVSLHDVAWRVCPETLPASLRFRLNWTTPGTLRRAKRVLVLTQAVRREIENYYGVPSDRIDIVPPYPDSDFQQPVSAEAVAIVRNKYKLPDEYIFYCGAMNPRKNLLRLARAVVGIADGPPLVIAGPRKWKSDAIRTALEAMNSGGNVRLIDYVDHTDLPVLMRAARLFAYIPLYEGFGMPVVEALAVGSKVLVSDIPSLREVAGEAAHYCDPVDPDSIRAALDVLLRESGSQSPCESTRAAGGTAYTPEWMAAAAVEAYRRAIR